MVIRERNLYRIARGLEDGFWYTTEGIKLESPIFDMPMDYDENHIGHICVVGSIKELIRYFKFKNIFRLVLFEGYKIYKIRTSEYKPYNGYYLISEQVYRNAIGGKRCCKGLSRTLKTL